MIGGRVEMPPTKPHSAINSIQEKLDSIKKALKEFYYRMGYLKGFQDAMELADKHALEARQEKPPF